MRNLLIPATLAALAGPLSAAACGHDHGAPAPAPAPAAEAPKPAEKPAAPTLTLGAWTVQVVIPAAPATGKPLDVDLVLTPADKAPKAVRLWVGVETGRGSTKVKAEPEKAGAYCVGVEVPEPLMDGAQVWVSVEADDGTVSKGAVALPKAAAK